MSDHTHAWKASTNRMFEVSKKRSEANRKITPEQRKEVAERAQSGEKPMDLATEYGISAGYVRSLKNGDSPS